MATTNIYIRPFNKEEREIEWAELNQLKKDILWIFDENTTQLNASFVPSESYQSCYWEYLTLDGDKWFYEEDRNFYKQGVLIIILCMTIEYIGTAGGNQKIFGQAKIENILRYIDTLETVNNNQEKLKELVRLGLTIANTMTEDDLLDSDDYDHPDLAKFYSHTGWVDTTFIKSYFKKLAE
jgi:hypothetical protein